jgi:polygalacturonase
MRNIRLLATSVSALFVGLAAKPAAAAVYDVTAYGAVGNGTTLDTAAIQSAINAAGATSGNTVLIPSGKTFLSGALFLMSNMTLDVEGTLKGTSDKSKYPIIWTRFAGKEQNCYASLVNGGSIDNTNSDRSAVKISNVTITGNGTIDANGSALYTAENGSGYARGRIVHFMQADNITLTNATFSHSPGWGIHFLYSAHVTVDNITINNESSGVGNGDGVDIESTHDAVVKNSSIQTQDDNVAVKSGDGSDGILIPSERIIIDNNSFVHGYGVAMGSEMSGSIRDVEVKNCTWTDSAALALVKSKRGRGGVIENVNYHDLNYNNTKTTTGGNWVPAAIAVFNTYPYSSAPLTYQTPDAGTPTMRNITFQNVTMTDTGTTRPAMILQGLPESPLQNIKLYHVTLTAQTGINGQYFDSVTLNNMTVNPITGPDYTWDMPANVHTLTGTAPPPAAIIYGLSVGDTANAANWSLQSDVEVGDTEFGDRTFAFNTVPSAVAGGQWIRRANASKSSSVNPIASFSITNAADVYVGWDSRVATPNWMATAGYTNTGLSLVNNEGTPRTFNLWKKNYPAGTVSLGGQNSNPNASDMYTVIIK